MRSMQRAREHVIRRMTDANRRTKWGRVGDFLHYIAISVSLVVFLILYGIHQADTKQPPGLPLKWLGFGIMTVFVFGNAIRYSKPFWRWPKFWGVLALFSIIHFGLGFFVVLRLTNVSLIHFAIATPIEYFALTTCLGRFLNKE